MRSAQYSQTIIGSVAAKAMRDTEPGSALDSRAFYRSALSLGYSHNLATHIAKRCTQYPVPFCPEAI